jgi:hypothetical protein
MHNFMVYLLAFTAWAMAIFSLGAACFSIRNREGLGVAIWGITSFTYAALFAMAAGLIH